MPRKPQNRSTPASFLVRCGEDELALIEEALEKLRPNLRHGAKLSKNGFVLDAALAEAKKVLGK
jgi:hypothetical protein